MADVFLEIRQLHCQIGIPLYYFIVQYCDLIQVLYELLISKIFVQKIFATAFILRMFAPLVLNVFVIPAITHAIVPFDNNIFVLRFLHSYVIYVPV